MPSPYNPTNPYDKPIGSALGQPDELSRVYGPTMGPLVGNFLSSLGRGFSLADPRGLQRPSLGPLASQFLGPFGQQQAQQMPNQLMPTAPAPQARFLAF